jgi:hypothetical protein
LAGPTEDLTIKPELLTDPHLQRPAHDSVEVAWVTEFTGRGHWLLQGADVAPIAEPDPAPIAAGAEDVVPADLDVRVTKASSIPLLHLREDGDSKPPVDAPYGPIERPLRRHAAWAEGLRPGEGVLYRVLSLDDAGRPVLSDVFTLGPKQRPGQAVKILLTSDYQTLPMTPANLQQVEETVGQVDASSSSAIWSISRIAPPSGSTMPAGSPSSRPARLADAYNAAVPRKVAEAA